MTASETNEEEWKPILTENMELVRELQRIPILGGLSKVYGRISGVRNDLNHAGVNDKPSKADAFSNRLREFYDEVCALYQSGSGKTGLSKK